MCTGDFIFGLYTVKSRLSERRLSETTGLFEDDGQSWIFSLLSNAIKLPIIRISIIRKIQFSEVICRSRLKKVLLNYPSKFEVQKSRMVIMISLFGRVRFTHLSELANKVATGNWHRIYVHTITWWTVKWVNGVFYQGRLQWWFCLMFFKCLIRGINELKLILIWLSRILWFILDQCILSEHTKRTDFEQQK